MADVQVRDGGTVFFNEDNRKVAQARSISMDGACAIKRCDSAPCTEPDFLTLYIPILQFTKKQEARSKTLHNA
jgi:hypothetical protein